MKSRLQRWYEACNNTEEALQQLIDIQEEFEKAGQSLFRNLDARLAFKLDLGIALNLIRDAKKLDLHPQ